jgi:hypothetical protein
MNAIVLQLHVLLLACFNSALTSENTVAYLLKARTVEPEKQPILGNSYVTRNGAIVGTVFSVRSVPSLYKEDQLPLLVSPETAVRRGEI